MKVIFLDIDGVLNYPSTEARSPGGWTGVASEPLRVLRKIVQATGAKIVLSSTWKDEWDRDDDLCTPDGRYLNRRLDRYGLHILDKTRDQVVDRGRGIRAWLDAHPHVDAWAVLDDVVFEDFPKYNIMEHLVLTDPAVGLTEAHMQTSLSLLTGKEDQDANL